MKTRHKIMEASIFNFDSGSTRIFFDQKLSSLAAIAGVHPSFFITDKHIFRAYPEHFPPSHTIVIPAGEKYKTQDTAGKIIDQLIDKGADRGSMLIGVGGGTVTDITGYVAGIYMRGIRFGFVPTSLLAMVDACLGGKNGINIGLYKNMVGTIRQPDFILYDYSFLKTLPDKEWSSGFAEIIKHGCILSKAIVDEMMMHDLTYYKKNKKAIGSLVKDNAVLKLKVVQKDEREKAERKLLNFGHTLGHAIENMYRLSHGEAISLGMIYACRLSEKTLGFRQTEEVAELLTRYGLPVKKKIDIEKAMDILLKDKKRENDLIHYILLRKIGKAEIVPIPLSALSFKTIIK